MAGPDAGLFDSELQKVLRGDLEIAANHLLLRKSENVESILEKFSSYAATGSCKRLRGRIKILWQGAEYEADSPNKLLWLADLSASDVIEIIMETEGTPTRTRGVHKMEAAKLRMLLPGPEAHWLVEMLALLDSERVVFSDRKEVTLQMTPLETLQGIMNRLEWLLLGSTVIAEDHDDFNIVHDLATLRRDYLELAQMLFKHLGVTYDSARLSLAANTSLPAIAGICCVLAAECLSNLEAKDPSESNSAPWHKLVRGLWSGWRTTMWFNTRMNRAYSSVVQKYVENEYGFPKTRGEYLVGDDSVLCSNTEYEGMRRLEGYDLCGFNSQAAKQLVDSTQTELTRIMHRADGSVNGSICRAIGNGCSHDLQGGRAFRGPHTASGLRDQMHMWIRRGYDRNVGKIMLEVMLDHWVQLTYIDDDGRLIKNKVPRVVVWGSTLDGGLGVAMPGETPPRLVVPLIIPACKRKQQAHASIAKQWDLRNPKLAANSLASRCKRLGLTADVDLATRALEGAVVASNLPAGVRSDVQHAEHKAFANALAARERKGNGMHNATRCTAEPDALDDDLLRVSKTVIRQTVNAISSLHASGSLTGWMDLWTMADIAACSALGSASSAPGILSTIKQMGRPISKYAAVSRLSVGTTSALARLRSRAGALTRSMIDDKIQHPPMFGLVASGHYVLVNLALDIGIRVLRSKAKYSTVDQCEVDNINNHLLLLASRVEQFIASDDVLGCQQRY